MLGQPGETVVADGVGQDPAALYEEDTIGEGECAPGALLGDDRRPAELADKSEEALRGLRVELRGRLVEEKDLRTKGERRREADTLQLAARELGRAPLREVQSADGLERLLRPGPDLLRGHAEVLQAEGNLVADKRHDDLVLRILEYRRRRPGERRRPRAARVDSGDQDTAREAASVEMRDEP